MPNKEKYWANPELNRRKTRDYTRQHPEWKKTYDREYAQRNKEARNLYSSRWITARHRAVRDILGDRCYCCGKVSGKLDLHHLTYPKGKLSKGNAGFFRRMKEAKENPSNFRLLCPSDHRMVTLLTVRKERIPRILEVLRDMAIPTDFDSDQRLWKSLVKRGVVA